MTFEVLQTRRFARQYKKMHDNIVCEVDKVVMLLAADLDLGTLKSGDLAHIRVYKFQAVNQHYLLAYSTEDVLKLIYLEALGVHENFYRDLK